jgi:hypothetical protein
VIVNRLTRGEREKKKRDYEWVFLLVNLMSLGLSGQTNIVYRHNTEKKREKVMSIPQFHANRGKKKRKE